MDDKRASRLIDRAVRALRRAGLADDLSSAGVDARGPYITVRDSSTAREVLQSVRQRGLRVDWGATRFDEHAHERLG